MLQSWSWKRFFNVSFLYFLFITAIVLGFLSWYMVTTVLTVQEVIVNKKREGALVGLQALQGMNLLFLEEREVEHLLLAQNPQVATLQVQKVFPSTLTISVRERYPVAYLKGDEGFFLLDETGKILLKTRTPEKKFPVISYYQQLNFVAYQAGNSITFKDILFTLYFIQKAKSLGVNAETVAMSGFHMIRLESNNKIILISAEKDQQTQAYQLETLVRELRIAGKDFKTLDLRFEKPIYEENKQRNNNE